MFHYKRITKNSVPKKRSEKGTKNFTVAARGCVCRSLKGRMQNPARSTRRDFIKRAMAATAVLPLTFDALGQSERTFILNAPLTHSDWLLKPNIAWGPEGVHHMLDACKKCGWNRVLWRVFDA